MLKKIEYCAYDELFPVLHSELKNVHRSVLFLTSGEVLLDNFLFFVPKDFCVFNLTDDQFLRPNLLAMTTVNKSFCVARFSDLNKFVPNVNDLKKLHLRLTVHDQFQVGEFKQRILSFGYEEVGVVSRKNEVAFRGDRVDVGLSADTILRIYLDFETIEALRIQRLDYELKITSVSDYVLLSHKIEANNSLISFFNNEWIIAYVAPNVHFTIHSQRIFQNNDIFEFSLIK